MEEIDRTIKDFLSATAKSKIAVVIPLYGFWRDIKNNPVNGEVLKVALSRIYSDIHQLYLIFVADPKTLPSDLNNPNSVANILLSKSKMGNTINLPISRDSTYAEYIETGMDYAVSETDAQFIAIFNPWVMIQDQGLDILVDRCNSGDDAKVVSGYDLRLEIEAENFNMFRANIPMEERDLSLDFIAMPRYVAEMITFDTEYLTHVFLQRDLWQQVSRESFDAITSQRVPIFPFDFPWEKYESKEEFQADKQRFIGKWTFDPGLKYEDPRGINRKDKTGAR